MRKKLGKMTTAQFAKLHHVNKRTLHYYDTIGLFMPQYKGDNGYRYYDYSQSIDFEYIRMLKEIKLSIEEIKEIIYNFDDDKFLHMVLSKQMEIDEEIKKLKKVKEVLQQKKEHVICCRHVHDLQIELREVEEESLAITPYAFEEDSIPNVFQYIQSVWTPQQYRSGVGSYIALTKIRNKKFDEYDGLFTIAMDTSQEQILIKQRGTYLCGYLIGDWNRLPILYEKMLHYANKHHLSLSGYAFETSLNDYTMVRKEEYITQVMIQVSMDSAANNKC